MGEWGMKSVLGRRVVEPVGLRRSAVAAAAVAACAAASLATATSGDALPAAQPAAGVHLEPIASTCNLGNGVKHVISLVFDNVHFARDNPNVPSDLEQMPHLLNFLESYGVVFSNSHTPLIAHTADDSLTIYTGLYGDRHGQPVTNSYKTYNPDGTTDPATSFAYWTDPVDDTGKPPTPGHDTTPSMVYSDTVPASGAPNRQTPAPWVPFTRAGCSVGDFSTANMVLENANFDIPTVFGAGSPEAAQLAADPDSFKDPEVADYVGVAVHCAQGDAVCANAQAVKFGQTSPSSSAVPDLLPSEPGGYTGYQALFGARYVAPQLGQGSPNLFHNGYEVTNAAGNLVDLNGNQINGAFLANHPGFPGFSPTATQTLAYLADMQEAGIPITYGYISDLHERKAGTSGCTTATATGSGKPLGPGDSCYATNAANYDAAFNTFFQRLAADGITPANTEFVISAEENDQFAGANVGRATSPTPAGCDGTTVYCHYAAGQIGELQANINGLLSGTASAGTAFDIEPQGAAVYVHGRPAADDPSVRQLERDTAAMTGNDPYTGVNGEKIVNYQASQLEEQALHMRTADPLRTPTYTIFPKPDFYFSTTGANVSINSSFAWNHGYYSPNIDVTWAAMVGPGVAARGVDGPQPADGNEAHDPNSTNTVPQASGTGTWVEETDLRPTLLYLLGLHDDYQTDGAVITAALTSVPASLRATQALAAGYAQLNSSVGRFATDTLIGDTRALASGSAANDVAFHAEQTVLGGLVQARDALAAQVKVFLANAARGVVYPAVAIQALVQAQQAVLHRADQFAALF
jgi:hypothetical protein